jgi:hypothetical protein
MISGVSLTWASTAWRFSVSCVTFEAPRITVLTLGFFRHQATEKTARLRPSSFAISPSFWTLSPFSFASRAICSFSQS